MRHYKTTGLFLSLTVMILFTTGCVNPADFTLSPSSQGESSIEAAVQFPDYVFDQETALNSYGAHASVQEKGYYLTANNVLYFYDVQSDTLFPLCTKESCRHKDDTCDAYVYVRQSWGYNGEGEDFMDDWAEEAIDYKIYYYRNHLYMIACNPSKGDALIQYSPEFTEQKMIGWLTDFKAEPRIVLQRLLELGTILFHQGYAYYITCLYDDEKAWGNMDCQTVYTAWRVRLEENAEAEELFSFDGEYYAGSQSFRIGSLQDDVYFMIEYPKTYYFDLSEEELENGENPWQIEGSYRRIYRYNEKDGVELIWSYDGAEIVSPFEAEGALPKNVYSKDYLINQEGDYIYFSGESDWGDSASISAVNLQTREGRILYETPYDCIKQLRSDGSNYYFIEFGEGPTFLTAIDKEGNLLRRYEIPYTEDFIKLMENNKVPEGEWARQAGDKVRLLVTDGRYIVLGGYYDNYYQGLSSTRDDYDFFNSNVDEGIGMINTEDFLNGKDIEIRQVYDRKNQY